MRIAYVNTWGGFEPSTFLVTRILKEENPKTEIDVGMMPGKSYDLVMSIMVPHVSNPTYANMEQVSCKKICFTGESYDLLRSTPGCDAYIGFDHVEDMTAAKKYMRFPLYAIYHYDHMLRYNCHSFEQLRDKFFVVNPKKKFSAVVSNPNNNLRTQVIGILCSMGLCDSGGRVHNNIGEIGWSFDAKMKLCSECSCGIAFENCLKKGYITEKIYECFMVGAVPYYWGASDIIEEFNPKAYHVFDSSSNESANQSLREMIHRLQDTSSLEQMRKVDPITGFRSEKYIRNGKEMLKTFIMDVMESK